MNSPTRHILVYSAMLSCLLTAGCASAKPTSTKASEPPTSIVDEAAIQSVPGFAVGDFPPIPLFRLPDLSLLNESADSFAVQVKDNLSNVPGVTVAPAHCDEAGAVVTGDGSGYLYGDGSGSFTGPDGSLRNYGDGSGTVTIGGVSITNYGDGSGTYDNGEVSINNYGDGSGTYSDADIKVQLFGDGSGTYTAGPVSIHNHGDGSGTYTSGAVSIQNYGDGSGAYSDEAVSIQNFGDGTGVVNGARIDVAPLEKVPRLGTFPPLEALAPVESCGTTITFSDAVLFDFARSNIRPDAAATLSMVGEILRSAEITRAVVSGHTDSIGSDADNQTLSEARARAVVENLIASGVTAALSAEGLGESRPVAPNEVDGADNPAGRQLNRRVEIFLPSAP